MSLHPGLFLCFRFSYGISRLRHFRNLEKRRRVFFKNGFFPFPQACFSLFLCKVAKPCPSIYFSLKDLESKDRVPGQGFDSLHTAKRSMFLDKKQLLSTFLLPFNAKMWRKMAKNTHQLLFFSPNLSLFTL